MARLPADVQLLALALLNYADDEGYFLAEASVIRSACLPFREDSGSVPVLVQSLIKSEWIEVTWSETHGPVGRVVSFQNHQVVNKPRKSKLKQYWGIPYLYGTNPVKLPDYSGSATVRNGMDQGMDQGMEGAESSVMPDSEGESDMGKKKNIVQETLIPPAFMESEKFMEAWTGFLEMRKEIKKPATDYAQKLLLRKLSDMAEGKSNIAIAILEQSVTSCWQDVYPLKNNNPTSFRSFPARGANEGDRPDLDFLPTGTE